MATDYDVQEFVYREHYKALLRGAEQAQLARQALSDRGRRKGVFRRALAWLGNSLAVRGQGLLPGAAADDPVQPVAAANQPR